MRITELLTQETIAMDLSSTDKNGVIDELVNQLDKAKKLKDKSHRLIVNDYKSQFNSSDTN